MGGTGRMGTSEALAASEALEPGDTPWAGDAPGADDGGGCRRPLGRWGGMPRRGPSFGGRCLCCSTGTNLGLFMC
ncbi:hypothetical protein GCM10010236_03900 [Streptomyces eurythermus]|nr:hypothetical protein GCM10010236_03900 [Streptomyces eurythermus]